MNDENLITFGQAMDAVARGEVAQYYHSDERGWLNIGIGCLWCAKMANQFKFRLALPPVDPYAELKAAHKAGKVIQCKQSANSFKDIAHPTWAWPSDCYRIKPAPTFRPWATVEEVPVGRIAKNKTNDFRAIVVGAFGDSSGPFVSWGAATMSAKKMFDERTMDDGSPCGVEVNP